MTENKLNGQVQTVLGTISPEALGVAMTHEHVLVDLTKLVDEPTNAWEKGLAHQPVSLENLWWIRSNPLHNYDNQQLVDEETAIHEVMMFKRAGGNTIMDATSKGIGRDPVGMARVSRATGVNIIMGAGYYIEKCYPPESNLESRSEEDIAQEIVQELTEGVDGTGIKAGMIGEVGCTWPITKTERKVLRASVRAALQTGAPMMIHPGHESTTSGQSPLQILEVLREAGANLRHTIMCHVDTRVDDFKDLRTLAEAGLYIAYDDFGLERESFRWKLADIPNDAQRIDLLKQLIAEGFGKQMLLSLGVSSKVRITRYGGHGYSHLLLNVLPRMRVKGISEEDIHTILLENPKRAFQFI